MSDLDPMARSARAYFNLMRTMDPSPRLLTAIEAAEIDAVTRRTLDESCTGGSADK